MQLQVETQIYKKDAIKDGVTRAGHKADYYISYISPETGIQVHNQYINDGTIQLDENGLPPYGDYVQINGDDISMWRSHKKKMSLDNTTLSFYGYNGNTQHTLATYGNSGIVLYQPGVNGTTGDPVITINSQGAYIAGSVQIGGKPQSEYLNDNIHVGGRNLILDTATQRVSSASAQDSGGIGSAYVSPSPVLSEYGLSVMNNIDDYWTYSFDYSVTGNSATDAFIYVQAKGTQASNPTYGCNVYDVPTGHFTHTFKLNTTQAPNSIKNCGIRLRRATDGAVLTVSNIKLEKGTKATDWTPAPEDIDVHQYIRISDGKLKVYQGETELASYGDTTTIGKTIGPKFTIDSNSLTAYDSSGNQYFTVNANNMSFGVSGSTNTVASTTNVTDAMQSVVTTVTQDISNKINAAKGNYTILWNYSNFSTLNNGEAYICKLDALTNTISDSNGIVMWNGTNRTITKQMVNPNTVVPYNIPIYIVCRLEEASLPSANATTGNNYMVWYNSGWKYAICPTPTAVEEEEWSWDNTADIIIGKFVEPGNEAALTEYEIYNPPLTSKQLTTNINTTTQAIANALEAATTATNYLDFDSVGSNGLRISQAKDYNKPYVQIINAGIKTIYDSTHYSLLDANGLKIYGGYNQPAASFGTSIVFYQPNSNTAAAIIDGNGISIQNGSINLGNFQVTTTGALTATSGTIGGFSFSGTQLNAYGTASGAGTSSNGLYRALIQSAPGTSGGGIAFGVGTRASTSDSWTWKISMKYNGKLTAQDADITGAIEATRFEAKDGDITRATVTSNGLQVYNSDGTQVIGQFNDNITLGITGTNNIYNTVITNSGLTINNNTIPIASFGKNINNQVEARIGVNNASNSNIYITEDAITMYNKGIATYELKNSNDRKIKVKITLGYSFHPLDNSYTLIIDLGREVSSWVNAGGVRGIVLTYELWGNDTASYSQSYNGPTVTDTSRKYAFESNLNLDNSTMTITIGPGNTLDGQETLYFTSVEFNFIATDPVVYNTIGAYADSTLSGPFRLGIGTTSDPSNAMLVDFSGNTKIRGDLFIKCNDDSTGGMPLGTVREYTQSSQSSELQDLFIDAFQVGSAVTLVIEFRKTTATASGANFFTEILEEIPAPADQAMRISGFGYTSTNIVGYWLAFTDGFWQLTARNLSSGTVGANFGLTASLTYVTDGTLCWDV